MRFCRVRKMLKILFVGIMIFGGSAFEVRAQAYAKAKQQIQLWAEIHRDVKPEVADPEDLKKLRNATTLVADEVPGLLEKGTLELLNSRGGHTAEDIRSKISDVLRAAPNYEPEVFVRRIEGKSGPEYILAFNVPYCASCSRAWIGLIGKRGNRFQVLSEQGDTFNNKNLRMKNLLPSESGSERFLICGTNLGDA